MKKLSQYLKRKLRKKTGNMDLYPKRRKLKIFIFSPPPPEEAVVKCDYLTEGLE